MNNQEYNRYLQIMGCAMYLNIPMTEQKAAVLLYGLKFEMVPVNIPKKENENVPANRNQYSA